MSYFPALSCDFSSHHSGFPFIVYVYTVCIFFYSFFPSLRPEIPPQGHLGRGLRRRPGAADAGSLWEEGAPHEATRRTWTPCAFHARYARHIDTAVALLIDPRPATSASHRLSCFAPLSSLLFVFPRNRCVYHPALITAVACDTCAQPLNQSRASSGLRTVADPRYSVSMTRDRYYPSSSHSGALLPNGNVHQGCEVTAVALSQLAPG